MQRRMSRAGLALVGVALLALGAAACGSDDDDGGAGGQSTAAGGKGEYTIGWVPPTVAPFEKAMRQGIEEQAKALGMKLVVAGGQFDPKVQIAAVDSLVQRDVDAIMIWPIDEKGIQPAFDRARAKDIPIITIDSPGARANVNFQTDDLQATEKLARYAAEKIGNPCRVAIIEGLPVVPILKARNQGYAQGAEAAGCEIVDKQVNTNDTPEKAGEIVKTWQTRFGDELTGILAVNDPSALAAAAAKGGGFDPVIVGVNGDAPNIEAINAGTIAATAALLSPEIGNGMAYVAKQLIEGKTVPTTIAANYFQVTKENIGDYKPYDERLTGPMKVSIEGSGNNGVLDAQIAAK